MISLREDKSREKIRKSHLEKTKAHKVRTLGG